MRKATFAELKQLSAMCHRLGGLSTCGLKAQRDMSTPPKLNFGHSPPLSLHYFTHPSKAHLSDWGRGV